MLIQILNAAQLVLSFLILIAIVLPLVRNSYWIFRIFEYPRFQLWCCAGIILLSWIFTLNGAGTANKILAGALAAGFIYLSYKIFPYTSLSAKQIKTVSDGNGDNQLKVLTANVYQDNRAYDRLLNQIKKADPDLILLVETDEEWKKAVDVISKDYPNFLGVALPNTYGMLMYSRLPIEGKVRFMVENDIPGIVANVELTSKKKICIWAVHPKPPVPGESDDSRAKDSEIMRVAFEVEKSKLPAIVMGDFNDVAWSKVTELFQKTAKLLDPRRGRGFYSTFSAHSAVVRFPLDYIFCSQEFGLISMKRLPKNGSDHFAIVTKLQLNEQLAQEQEVETTTVAEHEEAVEKAMGA